MPLTSQNGETAFKKKRKITSGTPVSKSGGVAGAESIKNGVWSKYVKQKYVRAED